MLITGINLLGGLLIGILQFGLTLAEPFPDRWDWLELLGVALFLVWLIVFYLGLALGTDLSIWQQWSNLLARYLLGFPGALMAAWGLRLQGKRHLLPLELGFVYNQLRIAGMALIGFALLVVVSSPSLHVFPANFLNAENFAKFLYFPPEVILVVISGVFATVTIRALEVFNIETQRLLDRMEQAQIVAIERERIARELHDGALQQVYAAGLLAKSLCRCIANSAEQDKLDRLWAALDGAIRELRQFLTTLQSPSQSENTDIHRVLASLVEEAARISGTEIVYHGESVRLPSEQATHLISFAREALSNAIRHARTSFIKVSLQKRNGRLLLTVEDHGVGLPDKVKRGFGLRNMEDRARLLGGAVRFESQAGQGTRVILSVPLGEPPSQRKDHEAENPSVDRG